MPHDSSWIVDVSEASFESDVLARSHDLPVAVDFWAEWCAPCRSLAPLLEKLAIEYDGKFLLAKARVEDVQQAAMAFGVSSIPHVIALRDGKIVDEFVGVLPEPNLRAWLDRLLPTRAQQLVAEAAALAATDAAAAEARLREAIASGPNEPAAQIALAQLLLDAGRHDEAEAIVQELAERGFLEPEAERIRADLRLKQTGLQAGDVEQARSRAAAVPADKRLRHALAQALAAAGQFDEALDLCLQLVQQDRQGVGDAARQTMIDIFNVLGGDDERTMSYRRRLSAAMY